MALSVSKQKVCKETIYVKKHNTSMYSLEEIITNGIYKTQNKNNIFFDKFDLTFFIIKICTKIPIKENILYENMRNHG